MSILQLHAWAANSQQSVYRQYWPTICTITLRTLEQRTWVTWRPRGTQILRCDWLCSKSWRAMGRLPHVTITWRRAARSLVRFEPPELENFLPGFCARTVILSQSFRKTPCSPSCKGTSGFEMLFSCKQINSNHDRYCLMLILIEVNFQVQLTVHSES